MLSAEMIVLNLVYNKVSVEYGFNVTREVKNMYFSFVASPLIFHFTREIKALFNRNI